MRLDDAAIQHLLWTEKLLTKEQIESAVLLAPSLGKSFVDTLIFKSFISEDKLGEVIAESLGVEYTPLKGRTIATEVLDLISEESAVAHQIVPFDKNATELHLAMADPTDFEIINFIEKKTGLIVRPHYAFPDQITIGLAQYKRDINTDLKKILNRVDDIGTDLTKLAEDVPTIKMLDTIMEYAIVQNASDVHIEGQETNSLVRFRIDGLLHDILVLDKKVQEAIVARIKYLSNLKIDEHRLPQDGRFKYEHIGNKVAVRVSILPAFYAENVVMRLLSETSKTQTLEELGFAPHNIEIIVREIQRTNGIILLTGPTGSGKTTTLYSLIERLNKPEVKIATIEDPVEYSVPRISQTQVNPASGLDFASGLRALLRHDPNIIMVGEIRDQETADISINAALTGHLVLSTLHTNDATSSIPRLIDLGVEPFLLAATIRVVVAQRLVRLLCSKCATPVQLTDAEVEELVNLTRFSADEIRSKTFFTPQGCSDCSDGYKGRLGIHEVLLVNETVNKLIVAHPNNDILRTEAIKEGMYTMLQDGIAKAGSGLTTIQEVLREVGRQN
ncbi:MAG TPA: GspE/PulE family protein [Patescibacteria group bacterium]